MKKVIQLGLFMFAILISNMVYSQCHKTSKKGKAVNISYHEQDLVDIAMDSDVHTTLVAAVKAADLVSTLKGEGPFTIFAPTNTAFDKLPDGTVASLLKPDNKSKLQSVLTYHVIAGEFDAHDVMSALEKGNGKFSIETVNGQKLQVSVKNNSLLLKDANGNYSAITATDLKGSNGVIHVIDSVVLPK